MKPWGRKPAEPKVVETHLWVTVPEPDARHRITLNVFHPYGQVPQRVQVEMFDAAREVLARWAANR